MFELIIKKSTFIAFAYEVTSKSQVSEINQELWKLHPKAKHICYAYLIFENGRLEEKGDDNSEPKGSAGIPLLNLLKIQKRQNIAVFVIRYFGGILLGKNKLPGAYIKTASGALKILDNKL
ncbi:YigZ family protein [Mycoplasma miroungirhinis]|uniref:YigZ family protein n=1 Tax=Mycoplasma miroungirhinis TaxID=754516 RepID=A0A6M4JCU7_9MOLU|nr:YigZ family protein [Mycoplasma miroungirhinis]QJR43889.1 YigZ family protein [Mycoplasma miroungirhinis]